MARGHHVEHEQEKHHNKHAGTHHIHGDVEELHHHNLRRGGEPKAEHDPKAHMYNAEGAPEAKEAEDEHPDFAKGGRRRKRKHGGQAEGKTEDVRHDRRPRRAAGGRTGSDHSPYSSAGIGAVAAKGGEHMGHEGAKPPEAMSHGGRHRGRASHRKEGE